MSAAGKQFPILVLDDVEVLRYLYATAFARATLEDMRIVSERNAFDIPGYIGNAARIDSASGDPMAVKMKAFQYYAMYVEGFHNRQKDSVESLEKFLGALAARREEYQQYISKLHAMVDRHNSAVIDFFTSAAHTAIKARTLGTVVMASIGAIAAVSGSAVAAPIALIYTGAKVVGGGGAMLASGQSAWGSAVAVAIGKYDNGQITLGEYSSNRTDKGLNALAASWEAEIGKQVSSQNQVVLQLEKQVAAQTKVLAAHARARDIAGAARTVRQMNTTSAALTAERQLAQRTAASGAFRTGAAQAFRRGMPIISAVNDFISAYGDYYADEALLESRR